MQSARWSFCAVFQKRLRLAYIKYAYGVGPLWVFTRCEATKREGT